MKVQITEYLDLDLDKELWCCNRCTRELGPARRNYKEFTLIYERNPHTVHKPYLDPRKYQYTLSPNPKWCSIIEFYCPGCGTMFEVEYLPLGHPITYDIELDIDALKNKYLRTGDVPSAEGT